VIGHELSEDIGVLTMIGHKVVPGIARAIGVIRLDRTSPFVVVSLFSGDVRPARDLAHSEHLVASKYPLATNCLT